MVIIGLITIFLAGYFLGVIMTEKHIIKNIQKLIEKFVKAKLILYTLPDQPFGIRPVLNDEDTKKWFELAREVGSRKNSDL